VEIYIYIERERETETEREIVTRVAENMEKLKSSFVASKNVQWYN
jgi:hypothetical protein